MAIHAAPVQSPDDTPPREERGFGDLGAGTRCSVRIESCFEQIISKSSAQGRDSAGSVPSDTYRRQVLHHEPAHDEGCVVSALV